MMELVDMLGLGSSSLMSKGSSPFFGKTKTQCQLIISYVRINEKKKKIK